MRKLKHNNNMIDASVLITCYNKEAYLDECVTSVKRQTKEPKEIIIVHDGCENPMHHADATTIMLKNNLGVSRARHEAFRFSVGKLILFLDGDDMISPDYLEKMYIPIGENKGDIIYPDIYFFGYGDNKLSISLDDYSPRMIKELGKFPIPISSLMNRDVYQSLNGFAEFPVLEDLDFWLRALCKGYTFKKAQTLLWYRQEGVKRNAVDLGKRRKIMDEIFGQFTITDTSITKNA